MDVEPVEPSLGGDPDRAFAQFRSTRHENGHFVLFHEPSAAELAMEFMKAVAR